MSVGREEFKPSRQSGRAVAVCKTVVERLSRFESYWRYMVKIPAFNAMEDTLVNGQKILTLLVAHSIGEELEMFDNYIRAIKSQGLETEFPNDIWRLTDDQISDVLWFENKGKDEFYVIQVVYTEKPVE